MTRRSLPPYVYEQRKKRNGYTYLEFRRGKVRKTMPPLGPEFWTLYSELTKGKVDPGRQTWANLVQSYKASTRWTTKKPRTQQDYDKALEHILRNWAKEDPAKLERKHVVAMRDAKAKQSVKLARDIIAVLSVLCEHAIDIGWRKDNPVKGTQRPKTENPLQRQPWPQELIDAFRREAQIGTQARLIFELCLGTGQRIGDVLSMRWADVSPEGIKVQQSKTGRALDIPLTSHLQFLLSVTPRNGIFLVAGAHGKPLTYHQARHEILKVRKAIGAEAYDIHSLRFTAASELARLGCTDEEIMAITGHQSRSMVVKYAGAERQKARAKTAQGKRK